MDDLRLRFEAPNEANRWDCPLFKVAAATKKPENISSSNGKATGPDANSPIQDTNCADTATKAESDTAISSVPSTSTSFKSSWKPKKKGKLLTGASSGNDNVSIFTMKTVQTVSTSAAAAAAAAAGGDIGTGYSSKSITFSGTAVNQEQSDDALAIFTSIDEAIPKIYEYFAGAAIPVPNSSTVTPMRANPDLLYELDRTSQKILQQVIAHQQSEIHITGTPLILHEFDRSLTLNRHAGLAELQRYRRQFVKINGQHPPTTPKEIGMSFIDFLALHV